MIETEAHERRLLAEADARERRFQAWRAFLERESIAAIVGAFLLVVLAGALIVAMFANVPIADIISNAFLLILGYFFGQSVSQAKREAAE